ncbi:MAG: hypothetical protein QG673_2345 [Pseudomonadota bacterium]|nr:hypothetical protein [Pseudomonadota bacterium]
MNKGTPVKQKIANVSQGMAFRMVQATNQVVKPKSNTENSTTSIPPANDNQSLYFSGPSSSNTTLIHTQIESQANAQIEIEEQIDNSIKAITAYSGLKGQCAHYLKICLLFIYFIPAGTIARRSPKDGGTTSSLARTTAIKNNLVLIAKFLVKNPQFNLDNFVQNTEAVYNDYNNDNNVKNTQTIRLADPESGELVPNTIEARQIYLTAEVELCITNDGKIISIPIRHTSDPDHKIGMVLFDKAKTDTETFKLFFQTLLIKLHYSNKRSYALDKSTKRTLEKDSGKLIYEDSQTGIPLHQKSVFGHYGNSLGRGGFGAIYPHESYVSSDIGTRLEAPEYLKKISNEKSKLTKAKIKKINALSMEIYRKIYILDLQNIIAIPIRHNHTKNGFDKSKSVFIESAGSRAPKPELIDALKINWFIHLAGGYGCDSTKKNWGAGRYDLDMDVSSEKRDLGGSFKEYPYYYAVWYEHYKNNPSTNSNQTVAFKQDLAHAYNNKHAYHKFKDELVGKIDYKAVWRLQSIAGIINSWVLDDFASKAELNLELETSTTINEFIPKFTNYIKPQLEKSLKGTDGYSATYTAEDLTEFISNWFFGQNPEQIIMFYNKYYGKDTPFKQQQQQLNKAVKELKHKKFEKIDECHKRISGLTTTIDQLKRNISEMKPPRHAQIVLG